MKLSKFDRGIISGLILVASVNIFSDYLGENFPDFKKGIGLVILILLIIWLTFNIIRIVIHLVTYGRYAIEIFLLDDKNNLLLIYHPYHKRWIPPGGRLKLFELPHEALVKKLKEESGLDENNFELHPVFHGDYFPKIIGKAEKVPRPYIVQKEHRMQRRFVKFHYDFIYVCRFVGTKPNLDTNINGDLYKPTWFNIENVEKISKEEGKPFDDVIDTYKNILKKISEKTKRNVIE